MKLQSNNTGTFTKQNSVTFDPSLWAATNGTIDWSNYPNQIPYTESDVYHTELKHTKTSDPVDISWTIRIGKGGHIYYLDIEGLGQIICPQRYMSPWNDDCMTTTVFSTNEKDDDLELGGNESFVNGYIHGSGMYIKPQMDALNNKPFYNPILSENFDSNDRSYTIINWGLVPKPNINRGDVLFYSRYRDLGNGILELTFYCYNFGDRVYDFAETPWFGFKPSKFSNIIKGGVNGSSNFELHNVDFADKKRIDKNRGWGAGTVDPYDPNSLTCALVWGSSSIGLGVNSGFVNRGERDMMLLAPSRSSFTMPYGTGIRYRRYLVMGRLKNVSNICQNIDKHAFFEEIVFPETNSAKLPLYKTTINGQFILTTDIVGSPVAHTFPIPVKDSLPLFLMKNNDSGNYFLSTDPYAACGKNPFTNPYPVGHPKYIKYQNRHIYQIYDEKTEWISLLGFVKQSTNIGVADPGFQLLSDVIGSINFEAGEKLNSNELLLPL